MSTQTMDLVELSFEDASSITGGEPVTALMMAYASALIGAAGAGFLWGYENLGPTFNRLF